MLIIFHYSRYILSHPEHLVSKAAFLSFRDVSWRDQLAAIIVDEAHIVPLWGQDFRIAFKQLGSLKTLFGKTQIVALTATATVQLQKDIISGLKMTNVKAGLNCV